jgi:chemotaxis methyl-accepting protein methylase
LQSILRVLKEKAQTLGLANLNEVLRRVDARPDESQEFHWFVDAITVGETSFYRHREQIEAVMAFIRDIHDSLERTVRVWCPGCSTGEEASTLVINFSRFSRFATPLRAIAPIYTSAPPMA